MPEKTKTIEITRNTFIDGESAVVGDKKTLPEPVANYLVKIGKAKFDGQDASTSNKGDAAEAKKIQGLSLAKAEPLIADTTSKKLLQAVLDLENKEEKPRAGFVQMVENRLDELGEA